MKPLSPEAHPRGLTEIMVSSRLGDGNKLLGEPFDAPGERRYHSPWGSFLVLT